MYKIAGIYVLYAKYSVYGLTSTRTHRYFRSDNSIGTETRTVWTEVGRKWLHDYFSQKPSVAG